MSYYWVFAGGYLYDTFSTLDIGWHHVVIVVSGPSYENNFSIYHDGNKIDDGKLSRPHSPKSSGSGKILIGGYGNEATTDIIFDELIFWNRALTDDEFKSVYESYSSKGN